MVDGVLHQVRVPQVLRKLSPVTHLGKYKGTLGSPLVNSIVDPEWFSPDIAFQVIPNPDPDPFLKQGQVSYDKFELYITRLQQDF